MRLKHGTQLGRQVASLASAQRMWWLLPLVAVMVLFAAAITGTTTALPVAVYTLF